MSEFGSGEMKSAPLHAFHEMPQLGGDGWLEGETGSFYDVLDDDKMTNIILDIEAQLPLGQQNLRPVQDQSDLVRDLFLSSVTLLENMRLEELTRPMTELNNCESATHDRVEMNDFCDSTSYSPVDSNDSVFGYDIHVPSQPYQRPSGSTSEDSQSSLNVSFDEFTFQHHTSVIPETVQSHNGDVMGAEDSDEADPQACITSTSCSSEEEMEDTPVKTRRRRTRRKRGTMLWEFLLETLEDPEHSPDKIKWVNKKDGIFTFVQSQEVAKLWGSRKNKPHMCYEHLSRAMRHYYARKIMTRIEHKRLMYQFGPRSGWKSRM